MKLTTEQYDKAVQDIGHVLSEHSDITFFLTCVMTPDGPFMIGTNMQNSLFLTDCAIALLNMASNMMKEKIVEEDSK